MPFQDRLARKAKKRQGDIDKATTHWATRTAALRELGVNTLGGVSRAQRDPALLRAHRAMKRGDIKEKNMNMKDYFKQKLNEAMQNKKTSKQDNESKKVSAKKGGTDPVYEAVKKIMLKRKSKAGGTDVTY